MTTQDTKQLVAHDTEDAVWHLMDGNRIRGTISQLPTDEFYCTMGEQELQGCHDDLESAEQALRDAVECADIEAEYEWDDVMRAVGEWGDNPDHDLSEAKAHEFFMAAFIAAVVCSSAMAVGLLTVAYIGILHILGWVF